MVIAHYTKGNRNEMKRRWKTSTKLCFLNCFLKRRSTKVGRGKHSNDDDNDNDNNNNNNNNNNNVGITGDRHVIKKEAEKILKYKDLTIEIQRMWNVKTSVIPVIIGATGTISKSFRKYVSDIPGNHDVKELQRTAILGTAHILRKVLNVKEQQNQRRN